MFQSLHFVLFSYLTVHTFASHNGPRQADHPPVQPGYFNTSTSPQQQQPAQQPWSASSLYSPSSHPSGFLPHSSSPGAWQPPNPPGLLPNGPTGASPPHSPPTQTSTPTTTTPSVPTSLSVPSAPFAPSITGSLPSQWSAASALYNSTSSFTPSTIPLATAPSPSSGLAVPPRPDSWSFSMGGKNNSRLLLSNQNSGPSAPITAGPQVTGAIPGLANHSAIQLRPGTVRGSSRPAMLLTGPVTLVNERNGTAVVQNNVTLTYLPPRPTNGSTPGYGIPDDPDDFPPGSDGHDTPRPGLPSKPHNQQPPNNGGKAHSGNTGNDSNQGSVGDHDFPSWDDGDKDHGGHGKVTMTSSPRPSRVVSPDDLSSLLMQNSVTGVVQPAALTPMSSGPTDFEGPHTTASPPPTTTAPGPTSFTDQPGAQSTPSAGSSVVALQPEQGPLEGPISNPSPTGLGNFGNGPPSTTTQPQSQTQFAQNKASNTGSTPGPQAPVVTPPQSGGPALPLVPSAPSVPSLLSSVFNIAAPGLGSQPQSGPTIAGNPAPAPTQATGPGPAPAPESGPAPPSASGPVSSPVVSPAPGQTQGSSPGSPQSPPTSSNTLNNFQNNAGISLVAAPAPSNGPSPIVSAPSFKSPSNPSSGPSGSFNNAPALPPAPANAGAGPPAADPVSSGDPAPTTDVAPLQVSAAPDVLNSIQAPVISVNGGAPPPKQVASSDPNVSVNPVAPVASGSANAEASLAGPGVVASQPTTVGSASNSESGSSQAPTAPLRPGSAPGVSSGSTSASPVIPAVNVGPQVIQAQAPAVAVSGHVVSLDASGVLSVDNRPSMTVPAPVLPSGPGAPVVSAAPGTSAGAVQIPDSPFKFAPANGPQSGSTSEGSAPVRSGQPQTPGGPASVAAPGQIIPTAGALPSASLSFAPQAAPSALNLGGQTVQAGAVPTTVSGHAFSLDTSGVLFVDGHASTNVAASGTATASTIPTAQFSFSQPPVSALEVKGQTLKAGSSAATASGHTFSLNTAGSLLVDGTPTDVPATQTSAPVASAPITFTPGTTPSPAATAVNLGGSTIQAGVAGLVMSGHAVSLDKSGVLYVDNAPSTVLKASASSAIPTASFELPSSGSSGAVSPSKPTSAVSQVQVGSQTLTAGGAAVTTASHILSLAPSGLLYVDGTPSSVLKPQSTAGVPSALISSFKPTASVPAADINGQSVYAGAKPKTIDGHTVSLDTAGVVRVDGTPSTTLKPSSGTAAPTTQMTFSTSPKPSASSSGSPGSAFGSTSGSSDGGPSNWQSSQSASGASRLELQGSMLSGVLAMLVTAMLQ